MAIAAQGTKVEIGTGTGTAKSVTAIALGNPTILTSAAHTLANGDVVTLGDFTGDDAATLNAKACVVKNVTNNTFAVDIDTTGKTIVGTAATATPVLWTEIKEIYDVNPDGGESSEIDTTHLRSTAKEFMTGLKDWGSISMDMAWLFDDAGQLALLEAQAAASKKDFKITYGNSKTATFKGYVKNVSGPTASVDDKLTGTASIKISGTVTFA